MARELNSEMLRRLQQQYGEMSDGELQQLAAKPDELTDFALEIMRGEMTRRSLRPGVSASASVAGVSRQWQGSDEAKRPMRAGSVSLMTFNDAIGAGDACDHLEEAGVSVDVRDLSSAIAGGGSFYGGPPVALELVVPAVDRARAVTILREKMGLFPLQEVEEAEEAVDDGTISALGHFGRREDAEEIGKALDDARIWHRIVANAEGTVQDENAYRLEVREVDLFEAGEVVERAVS